MKLPAIVQRHRALRWLAPVGVLCVAALAATGMFNADATSGSLPSTTPAQLIADVQGADVPGFSGTVVSQLSLGLPQLPSVGEDRVSFTSLLSGSHTLQVWYGGPDKQRVALLGSEDETDVFREGRDLWQWNSDDHTAVHTLLPARATHEHPPALPSGTASLTPTALARRLLGDLDPSTKVTVGGSREIAHRAAYQLVLTPRTSATKIASVRIAVDGQTKMPLGVQVFARGDSSAAVDVAFTSIRFGHQAERHFEFTPPPNAKVHQASSGSDHAGGPVALHGAPRTTGSGWATVAGATIGKAQAAKLERGAFGKALTRVTGAWGSGRLLDSALVSVLVTDDGRLFAGAVEPSILYAAAAK